MADPMLTISVALPTNEAWALAQFVKPVGWSEVCSNAVNDQEACEIRAAFQSLRTALGEAGFAPR